MVFDNNTNEVVKFERVPAEPVEGQVSRIFVTSRTYNGAVVRVIDGLDEALVYAVELKGTYVQRIRFNTRKFATAYETLASLCEKASWICRTTQSLWRSSKRSIVSLRSMSLQTIRADCTAVRGACALSCDPRSQLPQAEFVPSVYYNFDRDQIESWRWSYPSENPPRSVLKRFRRPLR